MVISQALDRSKAVRCRPEDQLPDIENLGSQVAWLRLKVASSTAIHQDFGRPSLPSNQR